MKIVFTGGGTGGHIFPIIAIIRELQKKLQVKNLKFFILAQKTKLPKFIFHTKISKLNG